MVALCARMPTPFHSHPMLLVNYPFIKPLASISSLTSLDTPLRSCLPPHTWDPILNTEDDISTPELFLVQYNN
jgi:hypothetical protein